MEKNDLSILSKHLNEVLPKCFPFRFFAISYNVYLLYLQKPTGTINNPLKSITGAY